MKDISELSTQEKLEVTRLIKKIKKLGRDSKFLWKKIDELIENSHNIDELEKQIDLL